MSMMKKIGAAALALMAVGCFYLGFSSQGDTDRVANFVRVTDGRVNAANDGKGVIVEGKLNVVAPIVDSATQLTFTGYPRIARKMDVYAKKDNKYVWNNKGSNYLIAETKVGDYTISPELLKHVSISNKLTKFNKNELNKRGLIALSFSNTSGVFIAEPRNVSRNFLNTIASSSALADKIEYNGSRRYSFSASDVKNGDTVTVIAKQQGNTLVPEDGKVSDPIRKGTLDNEAIKKEFKKDNMWSMVGCSVVALCFLGGAYYVYKK